MPAPSYVYLADLDAYQRIVDESLASPGRETGGLLVGRLFSVADGPVLVVVAASGPGASADRQAHTYAPDAAAHQRELEACRATYAAYQVDYVGEWHKHPPGHQQPSSGDTLQVIEILSDDGYNLPNGIFTPLVTIEDGTFMLHGHYYPRESMRPQPVACIVADGDIVQLLDSLAELEQHERTPLPNNPPSGGRWGISQAALGVARQTITPILGEADAVPPDQFDPETVIIDMHGYVAPASSVPSNQIDVPPFSVPSTIDDLPPAPRLPSRIERELGDLEQYCVTKKAQVQRHQYEDGRFWYTVTFAQPFPMPAHHRSSNQHYETPEGTVFVERPESAIVSEIVAIKLVPDDSASRNPPEVYVILSDERQLRITVERLFPTGWRSHFRMREVVKALFETLQQPQPQPIIDAIEFHGRIVIRKIETVFRSAADICADFNRHYSFDRSDPTKQTDSQE